MHQNYNTISKILRNITKSQEQADRAELLWLNHGNPDSYSYNYLILFSKWAERELNHHNPEITAGVSIDDPLYPVDIIGDYGDVAFSNIARAEKLNEIKQFGAWAVTAVEMLAAGSNFSEISRNLKIKKTDLIQRLTMLAERERAAGFDFGEGEI